MIRKFATIAIILLSALSANAERIQISPVGAGGGGGGGGSACVNQLVLDYSNSCALIGQAWGE